MVLPRPLSFQVKVGQYCCQSHPRSAILTPFACVRVSNTTNLAAVVIGPALEALSLSSTASEDRS
jgi:hypothetical protein